MNNIGRYTVGMIIGICILVLLKPEYTESDKFFAGILLVLQILQIVIDLFWRVEK